MGNTIRAGSAAPSIIRDARLTAARAEARGAPYHEDAQRQLAGCLASAVAIAAKVEQVALELEPIKAREAAIVLRAGDVVAYTRDEFFNKIGRVARDPVFRGMFPNGATGYIRVPRAMIPASLVLCATMLETHVHPLLPAELVAEFTAQIRQVSAELAEVHAELLPKVAAARLYAAHFIGNAGHTQVQLARLKKYWASTGMSEADIHRFIPDRPPARLRATTVTVTDIVQSVQPIDPAQTTT